MSLSRAQQILLKRAQAQAKLPDPDYRDALALISGLPDARSSKDPRLTDAHVDTVMSYFEAIYWRKVDAAEVAHLPKPTSVFRRRGFWSERNQRGNTTRDRFNESQVSAEITRLEADLGELGCNGAYLAGIRRRIVPFSPWKYAAALARTLGSRRKTADPY